MFMPQISFRQPGLTVCVDQKNKEQIYKTIKKQEILDIFIKMELDKACFHHGMTWGTLKV